MSKKSDFVHLHNHTEYSLLDGLSQIKPMLTKVKDLGMDSIAITDHGVMYGVIDFYNTCLKFGVKPIIGCEIYMARRSRFDKQPKIDADQYHLILLAKNYQGYQNLMKIVSKAHLEGFYYKPRADIDLLKEFHQGLIATTACLEGEIPSLIVNNNYQGAKKRAEEFLDIFGDDFYLEVQHHPKIKAQQKANKGIVKLSRELGIPLVATNDNHYIDKEDAEAQDALMAIQMQKTIDDPDRLSMLDAPSFYIRPAEEMIDAFTDYPDAIKNTREIADKCNVKIPRGKWRVPPFPIPDEYDSAADYFDYLIEKGLKRRYEKITEKIRQRVDYEKSTIINKGYETYFLIVQDIVNWAKAKGIRVGPGRGSVAGSIVSYALRITSVDPMFFELPFERFMHPDRPSTPDIDIDFADNRRDEVIHYVMEKYGYNKVAHIISFGRMESRSAIRDTGRVLGMPYSEPDKVAKLIPQGTSINEALDNNPELKSVYQEPKFKKLIDLAKKFEGQARHASIHAAGVVIGNKNLTNYVPLQLEPKTKEKRVTQYDMYSVDIDANKKAIGLLKIDFLGLRNLTILEKAKEFVKTTRDKVIDFSELPLDDQNAYKLLSKGQTIGIFQMESSGMQRYVKKLKPNSIFDVMAMLALYRPGPIQVIDEFINRKHNPDQVKYIHPKLESILNKSYGLITYQDDVLLTAVEVAGYSWIEADELRHAMSSKKHRPDMEKIKEKFVKGCIKNGLKRKKAEKLYTLIEPFGAYGFNKSHASCYALIAYQTAWMKANYPVEFMAALMSAESNNEDKIALAIDECRKMGIRILQPDINTSCTDFTLEKNNQTEKNYAIRFGLSAIKNVGEAAIEEIISIRDKDGRFSSLTDLCLRIDSRKVNKKVIESLIKAGAMDEFGKRSSMLASIDNIKKRADKKQRNLRNGQAGLFSGGDEKQVIEDKLIDMEEFSKDEILQLEKELLGFYLTEHPLKNKIDQLADVITHKTYQVKEKTSGKVKLAGIISNKRIVTTRKSGKEMAFVNLEDETGKAELVVFPSIFEKSKNLLKGDRLVLVTAKVDMRENEQSLIAEKIVDAKRFFNKNKDSKQEDKFDFHLKIPKGTNQNTLVKLNTILRKNQGEDNGVLEFPNGRDVKLSFGVSWTDKLKEKIEKLFNI
jgi:DNA polymerase III subunit alpha